ncbi:MAG: GNAT family N-acetyltransferase [Muribaculaceae bacterium]|nr:GNAT family N-acetyltransferase [Muribaculaceae bacterium]
MEIMHDCDNGLFYTVVDGVKAHVEYVIEDGGLNILHTIVPAAIGGRGIAGALVKEAYTFAQSKGLKAVATCSYAAKWLELHPDFAK